MEESGVKNLSKGVEENHANRPNKNLKELWLLKHNFPKRVDKKVEKR